VSSPDDGGSLFLRNIGIYLEVYLALQPRRSRLALTYVYSICIVTVAGYMSPRSCSVELLFVMNSEEYILAQLMFKRTGYSARTGGSSGLGVNQEPPCASEACCLVQEPHSLSSQ
jgi:hypothetical protein